MNDKNEKQPVWETHRRFYEWAKAHVADLTKGIGAAPSSIDFQKEAVKFFQHP